MKILIAFFIAFTTTHAQAISNNENVLVANSEIEASCSNVSKIGVLAKDNMPYWADSSQNGEVIEECYQAIVGEIQKSPFVDLRFAHSSVQILKTDEEFASFIEANENFPQELNNTKFNTDVPQAPSLLPITHPTSPAAFFTN